MQKMEKLFLDEVRTSPSILLPLTPAEWVGKPKYISATRILITYGGGIGGASYNEFVEVIDDIKPNTFINVKRVVDGKFFTINTKYIVEIENFDIAYMQFFSENGNYQKGIYHAYYLTEVGHKFEFLESDGITKI